MIKMAKLERVYNVPLRKEFLKVPKYKRSKKAVTAIKNFLTRHMKSENIKIGKELNRKIWEKGIKNPPHHVKINAVKEDDVVYADLFGFDAEPKKEETKAEKTGQKKEVRKFEEKKETNQETKKLEQKAPEKEVKNTEEKKEDTKPVKKQVKPSKPGPAEKLEAKMPAAKETVAKEKKTVTEKADVKEESEDSNRL